MLDKIHVPKRKDKSGPAMASVGEQISSLSAQISFSSSPPGFTF